MLHPDKPCPPNEQSPTLSAFGRLDGEVKPVADLAPAERERMYILLRQYFENTSRTQFEHDLAEKEWVILMADTQTGQIQGFSTLMRLQTNLNGQAVTALFSGDTIIRREYWGETILPRLWGRHVFSLADTMPDTKVYWFLICSGYKTYRFLSVFFCKFYPSYKHPTPPAIKQLLDTLGCLKFPTEYDPACGIVRFTQNMPLRPGVAEITPQRLKDPNIAFFAAANPTHVHGDELACLTEISHANLTRAGQRMLKMK